MNNFVAHLKLDRKSFGTKWICRSIRTQIAFKFHGHRWRWWPGPIIWTWDDSFDESGLKGLQSWWMGRCSPEWNSRHFVLNVFPVASVIYPHAYQLQVCHLWHTYRSLIFSSDPLIYGRESLKRSYFRQRSACIALMICLIFNERDHLRNFFMFWAPSLNGQLKTVKLNLILTKQQLKWVIV